MKTYPIFLAVFAILTVLACKKETIEPSNQASAPVNFIADQEGFFQQQNGYTAEGMVRLGMDENNLQWLRLASDFKASLSTGAVTVYLSKSQALNLNASTDFLRLDLVKTPGEHFFKVNPAVNADFKYVILWCASANVQFGNAVLN